jgi:L-aspartate oxidase
VQAVDPPASHGAHVHSDTTAEAEDTGVAEFDVETQAWSGADGWPDVAKTREHLQRLMTEGAGVVRSAASLAVATGAVDAVGAEVGRATAADRAHGELANLVVAARSLLASATVRAETRGAHARSDFPEASDRWRRRIVHVGDRVGLLRAEPPAESSPLRAPGR